MKNRRTDISCRIKKSNRKCSDQCDHDRTRAIRRGPKRADRSDI